MKTASSMELRLAGNVRAVVDEVLRRIRTLPDQEKRTGSPTLLSLFDLLTSVINEEIVLQAVAYADSNGVKLHTQLSDEKADDEKEEVEEAPEIKKERLSACSNQPNAEADATLIEGDFEFDPNDTIFDFDVVIKQENESPKSVKREVVSQDSIRISKNFSNKTLEEEEEDIKNVIHPSFDLNLSASSEEDLPPVEIERGLRFYEINCSHGANSIFLLPEVNFCPCEFFQKYVLNRQDEFTCSHVLGSWVSQALGTTKLVYSRLETLEIIARQFAERTNEFY